jgi:hypothetical protein
MERKYYLATPGGKSMEAIEAWKNLYREEYDKLKEFAKDYQSGTEFLYNRRIFGSEV